MASPALQHPDFSAAEWAALFPSPQTPAPSFAPPPPPVAPPTRMTRAQLLSALPAPLAFAARLQLSLAPLAAPLIPRLFAVGTVPWAALLGALFAFGADTFPRRQMGIAAGTSAAYYATVYVGWFVSSASKHGVTRVQAFGATKLFGFRLRGPPGKGDGEENPVALEEAAVRDSLVASGAEGLGSWSELESYDVAGVARYVLLVSADPKSPLVAHDANDSANCPCPAPSCAGRLLAAAGPVRIVEMLGRSLMDAAVYFTMSYSSIVTLAPATWTHWWSALFAAVACAVAPILFSLVTGISMIFLGIPQMELSRRLTLRAAHLSLASFFAQIERGSTCIDAEDAPTAGGPEPLYLVLHRRLTAEWISRANATTGGRYFLVLLSFCAFVAGAVYATAGGCLPAWPVLLFAITVLDVTRNLFVAAASNSGVTDCSATHGRAGTRVRELLAAGGPRGPGEHRSLKAHGALLSSLANDEAYKGSFMGFRVGYGAARTFVVTMFTVLVGVWSILRGIGIYLSADNVCRGGDLS